MIEFNLAEGNIAEMVHKFRSRFPEHRAEVLIYGDATGHARSSQTNKSNYVLILNEMRTYPVPCRLKVPESNPPIISRINSMQYALRSDTGEPNLFVDPACTELIRDLEQVKLTPDGKILKTSRPSDPYSKRTHISDALGYYIAMAKPLKIETGSLNPIRKRAPVY
jgi:hypothetical protein